MRVTREVSHPDERPWLGVFLRVLAGLLFAAMSICVKGLSGSTPLGEIVFFRSLFALIPLAVFLWVRSELPSGLATRRPLGHLLRSALGAAAMFASFRRNRPPAACRGDAAWLSGTDLHGNRQRLHPIRADDGRTR